MDVIQDYIQTIAEIYEIVNPKIIYDYFTLEQWHEVSDNNDSIDLNFDVIIVTDILVEGIATATDIITNDFISLAYDNKILDLKPFTKTNINGTLATIEVNNLNIPIQPELKIIWDKSNFVIPVEADIKSAFIKYIKLINT